MSHWKIAVLVAAFPAVALPQAAALDQARGAGAVQQAGVERRAAIIDPALAEEATAPAAPAAPAEQGAVNLTPAAERLEGVATVVEGQPGSRDAGPETYVVKKGDTLWDLSGRYLDSPWYWPKLWSYNPQIENPHWIYPGNELRLAPVGPQAPARVEPAMAADVEAPRELDDLTKGSLQRAERIDDEESVAVSGPYAIGGARPKGPAVLRNSFVTPHTLESSGEVVGASAEKLYLTTGDTIYGKFRKGVDAPVGQQFSVYRTEGPLVHPVTKRTVGYKTMILGTARVTATEPGKATKLLVTYVNDGIERGDLIGPAVDQARKPLFTRPNRIAVDGYVIGLQPAIVTGAAEYNVVYLDKGKADGVEVGNTFEVVRSGDPYSADMDVPVNDPRLPREVIGNVVVFDAQERASSAYVRRSIFELLVGDHVEMRPTADAGPVKSGG